MGRLLIIAYHFPPCAGSSGLLRSEKFARYLPEFGWEPCVLTVHPRAYEAVDSSSQDKFTGPVVRAFALDTKKHLGFRGFYLDWMALPDRWVGWLFGAIPAGLRMIRKYRADVIFSTFPVSTAILAGLLLHRMTGKPWVVDLRDSMTEESYPKDPRTRRVRRWIERQAIQRASRVIFTSESTLKMYLERYANLSPGNCLLIPNGYDEDDFASLSVAETSEASPDRCLKLLHTGLIYPEERDPMPFFRALGRLKAENAISSANLKIVFRASGSEDLFRKAIRELGIAELVELQPHVPYRQALQECADADGLLLFQAGNCDHQTPAKTYEYLRLQKPILAVTTHSGDTAALLNRVGGATIVKLAEEDDIYEKLPHFLTALRTATHPLPNLEEVQRYARKSQAAELARCLSGLTTHQTKQPESLAQEQRI